MSLKPLPYSVTKAQLVEMYLNQLSEKTIRSNINIILQSQKLNKKLKRIPHSSFMEFVEIFGLPQNYIKSDLVQ